MSTSVNAQSSAIIAKDILIAAISGDKPSIHTLSDPVKGAEQLAAAYEILHKKVSALGS